MENRLHREPQKGATLFSTIILAYFYAFCASENGSKILVSLTTWYDVITRSCGNASYWVRESRGRPLLGVRLIESVVRNFRRKWSNVRLFSLFRPPDVGRESLKFYPWTSFIFFINSPCSAAAQWMGHRMYFGGSVVGRPKASTIGIEISPTPPPVFTGRGLKSVKFASFKTSLNFGPSAFENAARYPKSETKVQCCDDRPMFWPSLVKFHAPLRKLCQFCPIARENVLTRQ